MRLLWSGHADGARPGSPASGSSRAFSPMLRAVGPACSAAKEERALRWGRWYV